MSCEQFKSRMTDFALGADDAGFRAHLDACPSCRAELAAQRELLASIDRGVASMVAASPSGDFAAQVRRRIAQEGGAPRTWFSAWMPVTATAALALVVLVAVLTIGRPPRPPQSVRVAPPAPIAPAETSREASPPSVAAPHSPPRGEQPAAKREPEVLVPRGEMAAVMRMYNAAWNGQADGASLMAAAIPAAEILKPMTTPELKTSPLVVERLGEEEKPKGNLENR